MLIEWPMKLQASKIILTITNYLKLGLVLWLTFIQEEGIVYMEREWGGSGSVA